MSTARVQERQRLRRAVKDDRASQVEALYPHARTFVLRGVDPVTQGADPSRVPTSITLVTPDLDDPSKDHLFIGPHAVLSTHHKYDPAFEELTFVTSDGSEPINGHLRLVHSRTQAYGVLDIGDSAYAVEYEVKPQTYLMKVGKGAAYLGGTSTAPLITWDENSDRWKTAPWTDDDQVSFTYGVDGQEVVGDEKLYTFVASFKDLVTNRDWKPDPIFYGGLIDRKQMLHFGLMAGAKPPPSGRDDGNMFPFLLRVKLSEFGYDFVGGMLTDRPDLQGTVYGLRGTWSGGQVAGLYHVQGSDVGDAVIGVHDGKLHVGSAPVERSAMSGNTMTWRGLTQEQRAATGLPESGEMTFSPDGHRIVDSPHGVSGRRVHPDDALAAAASSPIGTALKHAQTLGVDPEHNITRLLAMSQYVQNEHGIYYDQFQQESMQDFYDILQHYMDADLRRDFFNPKPFDPALEPIARTPGTKGTNPKDWYYELSIAYTTATLANWSTDPAAKMLNGHRADAWLRNQTGIGDVMLAQGPLLYARRYKAKFDIDWYLNDQNQNAAKYEKDIDAAVAAWIAQAKASVAGTEKDIQKLVDQITEMGQTAKSKKLYWAFTLYAATTKAPYLNMLQTILASGAEVDGSEFTQRVQRTVALLNVLDTSSYFTQQYAYLLQLFQIANVLPQLMDYSNDLTDFSFAVKQIVDKFIKDYIDSPDPGMRDAAEKLRQHATEDTVSRILQVLRQSSAAMGGLYNWTNLAATFERTAAKVLSHLPTVVTKMVMLSAVGLMVTFFVSGQIEWKDIPPAEQAIIILNGAGILAQLGLFIVKRGLALSEVFVSGNGLWNNVKLFFSADLMAQAQSRSAWGFKGWLLATGGLDEELSVLSMRSLFAEGAELAAIEAEASRINTLAKIFGRNLDEFLATRLGAALAAVGIVMSAILLAQSHEPLEIAANSLFLVAATLEFIATAGAWAAGAAGVVALGGVAVSTILAIVSVVGVVAMVAGAILIAILMFQPKPSPVEKFAKDKAGTYYMPHQTDVDYFQTYQTGNEPQRAGIAALVDGSEKRAMHVGDDGALRQAEYDGTGHTAFYLRTDEFGRAQVGAPVVDATGTNHFYVLGVDDNGALVATKATADTMTDPKQLWRAEIQGPGRFDGSGDDKFLRSAVFKVYNEYWKEKKGAKRYIVADGTTGWTAKDGDGTALTLEMVMTKPQGVKLSDISWFTYQHDQKRSPGLAVIGSAPRKWSIEPALPEGLLFDTESGIISMEIGVDVPVAAKKTYKLTVTNVAGAATTDFTLEVKAAENLVELQPA